MKLTIAAVVSTIAAMVFCLGYAGEFGVLRRDDYRSPQANGNVVTSGVEWIAVLECGGIRLDRDGYISKPLPPQHRDIFAGHYWMPQHQMAPIEIKRLWTFRFRRVHGTNRFTASALETQLEFPIWSLQGVLSIAPAAWMRRRRRNSHAGFAVITRDPK